MLVFPNAKINLGLYVTAKRGDGFHNIESIFLPVSLCDSLDLIQTPGENFQMEILNRKIDGELSDNTCAKAWQILNKQHGIGGVKSILLKNIPSGAGLGGGSADGAFMLKALNELFGLDLSNDKLKEYAAQIGSDCPFFIENTPQFVCGRGEILQPIQLHLSGYYILIVHPEIHISTAEAYSVIQPKEPNLDLRNIRSLPISKWKNELKNQFEEPVGKRHPEIIRIKDTLYSQGAVYASMSGSGSAVYGIFEHRPKIDKLLSEYFSRTVRVV